MAVAKTILINGFTILAKPKTVTLSGSVEVDGSPASRKIYVYRADKPGTPIETLSDGSGNWSIDYTGAGTNDEFRAICAGESGENSEIYEHV